jgi:hypothetical protein
MTVITGNSDRLGGEIGAAVTFELAGIGVAVESAADVVAMT